MGRSKPTSDEIISLTKQLNDGGIKKRREAGDRLQRMLSDDNSRRRLAVEAVPHHNHGGHSVKARRRQALAGIWRLAIQTAVQSVNSIALGKSKFSAEDAMLPYKLLMACTRPDEYFEDDQSKLSRKETKLILNFCLDMLDDEKNLEVDGVEKLMLEMLAHICSRPEFVVYFKPEKHISLILEEVEKRLVPDEENGAIHVETDIVGCATDVFGKLMSTCQDLGLSLHLVLPGCIKFAAIWFARINSEKGDINRGPEENKLVAPILSGLAVLLRMHPDLAVAPLSRHGKPVLRFVKRRLGTGLGKLSSTYALALLEYLQRHLVVCQVAGKLQGLLAGDLGDLQEASLSLKTISNLLDALLQSMATVVEQHQDAYKMQVLELIVRLLACAQRIYLCTAEWNKSNHPVQAAEELIRNQPNKEDYYQMENCIGQTPASTCFADLSKAPFVDKILRDICSIDPETIRTSISSLEESLDRDLTHGVSGNSRIRYLQALTGSMSGPSAKDDTVISKLQILCAAAEVFPLGSCWTSSTQNWYKISPEIGNFSSGPISVFGGSQDDLAVLVEVISNALKVHGSFNGSSEVQKWTLISLSKLAGATEAMVAVCGNGSTSLIDAWKKIWSILLQSNLSYAAMTNSSESGSNGDLILRLLTQIVRFECTVPVSEGSANNMEFIFSAQHELWKLPVFRQMDVRSPSGCMLILAFLENVGLIDEGSDTIGGSSLETDEGASDLQLAEGNRRARLVSFCLHCVQSSLGSQNNVDLLSMASLCIASLVSGTSLQLTSAFYTTGRPLLCSYLLLPGDTTHTSVTASASEPLLNDDSGYLYSLWVPVFLPIINPNVAAVDCTDQLFDIVRAALHGTYRQVRDKEQRRSTRNTIGQEQMDRLYCFSSTCFASIGEKLCEDKLSKRLSLTKALLTVMLCCNKDIVSLTFDSVVNQVNAILNEFVANVGPLSRDMAEFQTVLESIVQVVRGLVFGNAALKIAWPASFIEHARSLYDVCDSILSDYASEAETDLSVPESSQEASQRSTDLLFDDYDESGTDQKRPTIDGPDEGSPHDRKRKRRITLTRRQRKRRSSMPSVETNRTVTCLVAALLIALNPSYKDCLYIGKTLLGIEEFGIEDPELEYGIDTKGGVAAISILFTRHLISMVAIRDPAVTDPPSRQSQDSVVSLLCQIIQEIRASSDPHTVTHLFGYCHCGEIVRFRDSNPVCTALSDSEARIVVSLLMNPDSNHERRSLVSRPHFRVQQLSSASSAFRHAGANTLNVFDNDFGELLSPSISDICGVVRKGAFDALAAAMSVLSEERVIESARSLLAPIAEKGSKAELRRQYRRWYATKSRFGGNENSNSNSEKQVWEDAHAALQLDALTAWCIFAECSPRHEIAQTVLFDLIRLAANHPELESLCRGAAERISVGIDDFGTAEMLICSEGRFLSHNWLDSGYGLYEMPLLMSSPITIRRLLEDGNWRSLLEKNTPVDGSISELDRLKETATSEFLASRPYNILPKVVLSSVSHLVDSSVTKDGRRRLLEDPLIKEYCSAFSDHFDDDVVRSTLKREMACIYAECAVVRESSAKGPAIAEGVTKLFTGLLSEETMQQRSASVFGLSIRRLIEITGDDENLSLEHCLSMLRSFGTVMSKSTDSRAGVAADNSIELLLLAKFYLKNAVSMRQLLLRWKGIEVVIALLIEDLGHSEQRRTQLNFCMQTVLEVLADPKMGVLHLPVLRLCRKVIDAMIITGESRPEIWLGKPSVAKILFVICCNLHKECQQVFEQACRGSALLHEAILGRNKGILSAGEVVQDTTDAWNWTSIQHNEFDDLASILKFSRAVPSTVTNCMKETFQLVTLLLKESELLGLDRAAVDSVLQDTTRRPLYTELAHIQSSYAAQNHLIKFIEGSPDATSNLNSLSTSMTGLVSGHFSNRSILKAELQSMERALRRRRTSSSEHAGMGPKDAKTLVEELMQFLSGQTSQDARLAASRCLGEIELFGAEISLCYPLKARADNMARIDEVESGTLLRRLHATIIESLALSLQRIDSRRAMVGIDTLKSLLASRVGKDCRELITGSEAVSVLDALQSAARPFHTSRLFLTETEVHQSVKQVLGSNQFVDQSWCFDPSLWLLASTNFDSWIRRLVPSLLVCNYGAGGRSVSRENAPSNFLAICQRMCSFDSDFAAAVFPAIVLNLLLDEDVNPKNPETNGVCADTWLGWHENDINKKFSQSFDLVLRHHCQDDDRRAIELVVDVLDHLRQITQENFLSSPNHRMTSGSAGTISWRAPPWGVVLKLDGLLVAQACIQAHRFESAMFYAEMFADVRFGGSTSVRKLISDRKMRENFDGRSGDISGFGSFSAQRNKGIEEEMFSFFGLLHQCYGHVGEQSAQIAMGRLKADFAFFTGKDAVQEMRRDQPPTYHLEVLDNLSSMDSGSGPTRLSIANYLESLGVHETLETYISGLTSTSVFSEAEKCSLREKWFECRFFKLQWDDSFFSEPIGQSGGELSEPATLSAISDCLNSNGSAGFYEMMVNALVALRSDNLDACRVRLHSARKDLVDRLTSGISSKIETISISDAIDRFEALNDLDDFMDASGSINMLLDRFKEKRASKALSSSAFSNSFREITMRCLPSRSLPSLQKISKEVTSQLEIRFNAGLESGHLKEADGALRRLRFFTKGQNFVVDPLRLRILEATLFEKRGEINDAIRAAKLTATSLRQKKDQNLAQQILLADALTLCGKWLTQYKVEPGKLIIDNYLEAAVHVSRSIMDGGEKTTADADRRTRSFLALGDCAYKLYETVAARVSSSEWKQAGAGLNDREKELAALKSKIEDLRKECNQLSKKASQDKSNPLVAKLCEYNKWATNLTREIDATKHQRETILEAMRKHRHESMSAIQMALSSTGSSQSEDLSKFVYRIVSLWFSAEEDNDWSPDVDETMKNAVEKTPSFRYVPLLNQLLSRIDVSSPKAACFQNRMTQLIQRMSIDHPYHCLVHIVALSNSDGGKSLAAASILKAISESGSSFTRSLIEGYEKVSSAYIHLAMAVVDQAQRGIKISFDKVSKSASLRLDKCLGSGSRKHSHPPCVLTKPPPLRADCDYGDDVNDPIGGERIKGFEGSFHLAPGGITLPKIIFCIGTRGTRFKQLVKGKDDTRQDAVMEQVFSRVNELMVRRAGAPCRRNAFTGGRDLSLVTYGVIPLNREAGVLEWVENTTPLSSYLYSTGPKADDAHSRYCPGEWSHRDCLTAMKAAEDKHKRAAFESICAHFSPVLRYFFIEMFGHSAENWFTAKTKFARSVAVNSIVGHILGIGDRHGGNILLHKLTGECIHIDFGFVFEQGKVLASPEMVPFRLTQNILDGMGPTGTEGIFTEAAEATLSTLRENSDGLLTILSAVVSDPLYHWSVAAGQANDAKTAGNDKDQSQPGRRRGRASSSSGKGPNKSNSKGNNDNVKEDGNENENRNEMAAHAISRIHEKLQGYEDGTSGEQQTVESQVQLLINAAREPDNLCRMFPGWAPWG